MSISDKNKIPNILTDFDNFFLELKDDIAEEVKTNIKDTFDKEGPGWKPLHWFTIQEKGHDTILIETGQLVNSIHVMNPKSNDPNRYIGLFEDKAAPDRVFIGNIQEFGASIPITSKMRNYLGSRGFYLSLATTHIHIPERSFLRLGWDLHLIEIINDISRKIQQFFNKYTM